MRHGNDELFGGDIDDLIKELNHAKARSQNLPDEKLEQLHELVGIAKDEFRSVLKSEGIGTYESRAPMPATCRHCGGYLNGPFCAVRCEGSVQAPVKVAVQPPSKHTTACPACRGKADVAVIEVKPNVQRLSVICKECNYRKSSFRNREEVNLNRFPMKGRYGDGEIEK